MGGGPAYRRWTVYYYYNGQPIPRDHGGEQDIYFVVYRIEELTSTPPPRPWLPNPPPVTTILSEKSTLTFWPNGTVPGFNADVIRGQTDFFSDPPTRKIVRYARVFGPPECQGSFTGVTIGISQTVSEAIVFGSKRYHRATANNLPPPPDTATGIYVPVNIQIPPAWWDGPSAQLAPFYTVGPLVGPVKFGGLVYQQDTMPIVLEDTPGELLESFLYTPGGSIISDTYDWGLWTSQTRRERGGNGRYVRYEDIMSASYGQIPAVVVPVVFYDAFAMTYEGYLETGWQGGSVVRVGPFGLRPVREMSGAVPQTQWRPYSMSFHRECVVLARTERAEK